MQMNRKRLTIGIILLFVGLSILSNTAQGHTWVYAHVEGHIDGVPSNAVTWKYASPQNSMIKWKVINLVFTSSKGNGSITVKPIARSVQYYDFPEDFTSLKILFIYNYLGGIVLQPGAEDEYTFLCRGHGFFVEIN